MKKRLLIPIILICIFSLNANATDNNASKKHLITSESKSANSSIAASILFDRLHEIQALTKKDLSSTEKSALRKEVKGIKQELKQMDGGIYISAGVLILILILILIL